MRTIRVDPARSVVEYVAARSFVPKMPCQCRAADVTCVPEAYRRTLPASHGLVAERKHKVLSFADKPAVKQEPRPELKREVEAELERRWEKSKPIRIFAIIAILAVSSWIIVALFSPVLRYQLATPPKAPITSDQFRRELQALTQSRFADGVSVEPLPNGEQFYPAEIDGIKGAQKSVNIEAYIFERGDVTEQVVQALTERARAGVQVRLVLDAMGSFSTPKRFFKSLRDAGGKVQFYHPVRWNTWMRSNNRTHREMTIIDGKLGFIGGAGFADHWLEDKEKHARWRDTMFRVRGEAVTALQGTFVENWLEASGELLSGDDFFPLMDKPGSATTFLIASSPSQGGSTRGRILFQTMLASAKQSLDITTPYFLPDDSLQHALIEAKKRGVRVRILLPGDKSDHLMTRASSRRTYGDLLQAGIQISEYQPAMIHAKIMIVDGVWSIVGSTNFDNRSFGINDEVNLAALDPQVAGSLTRQFEKDLSSAKQVSYDDWKKRSMWERAVEWAGWILERQQ
jgi:cardiolipin synthase A/B